MSNKHQMVVCRRCGRGFVLTSTHLKFLARWGVKVMVPMQCMNCFLKAGPLPKQRGEVKWFSPRRGYGFIVTEKGEEVFFHRNELVQSNGNVPHEGQTTQFHVRHSVKGAEALNVELVGE